MPKAAAKAATSKARAGKTASTTPPAKQGRAVPEHLLVPTEPGEWPTQLDHDVAEKLFAFIEDGLTIKGACKELAEQGITLERNTVAQWKRRHSAFASRIEEAIDIGIDCQIDDSIEIVDTASDRDSAAAAQVRLKGREEYRKLRRPERFNVTASKPALPGGAEGLLVGVVIVPARSDTAGHVPVRQAIDSTATKIERLPIDSTPAPAFKVTTDG